jgi:hypothetical protein
MTKHRRRRWSVELILQHRVVGRAMLQRSKTNYKCANKQRTKHTQPSTLIKQLSRKSTNDLDQRCGCLNRGGSFCIAQHTTKSYIIRCDCVRCLFLFFVFCFLANTVTCDIRKSARIGLMSKYGGLPSAIWMTVMPSAHTSTCPRSHRSGGRLLHQSIDSNNEMCKKKRLRVLWQCNLARQISLPAPESTACRSSSKNIQRLEFGLPLNRETADRQTCILV